MVWFAKPGCPQHHRQALERAVNAMPAEWRGPTKTGDIFEDIVICQRRLQGFSFVEGFAVVTASGGTMACPGRVLKCIFRSLKTQNYCELEDIIEKDKEGKITSQRKREVTTVS
jgi:hypothetical protein